MHITVSGGFQIKLGNLKMIFHNLHVVNAYLDTFHLFICFIKQFKLVKIDCTFVSIKGTDNYMYAKYLNYEDSVFDF